jgi:hypothetical protein
MTVAIENKLAGTRMRDLNRNPRIIPAIAPAMRKIVITQLLRALESQYREHIHSDVWQKINNVHTPQLGGAVAWTADCSNPLKAEWKAGIKGPKMPLVAVPRPRLVRPGH